MGTRSIHRELGQHHAPLVRPLGEASRRAEPEPASGRASKPWLPTARVVDIGYCGYSEPFGGAGEGHTGLRLGLAGASLIPIPTSRNSVGKGLRKMGVGSGRFETLQDESCVCVYDIDASPGYVVNNGKVGDLRFPPNVLPVRC